VSFNPRKQN
jgi:WD40 repeat protein